MLSILLTIVKLIGIILLCLIGVLVMMLILLLFVPVRYQIKGYRTSSMKAPVYVQIKVTWLLRIIRAFFVYPEAAYIRIKVLFFTIYNSSKEKRAPKKKKEKRNNKIAREETKESAKENKKRDKKVEEPVEKPVEKRIEGSKQEEKASGAGPKEPSVFFRIKKFFLKIWNIIKNIRYTILEICAKIKEAVSNIRYYIEILKSDEFQKSFALCAGQLRRIYKNVKPSKLKATLIVGTDDPALTGQILEIYSILYPLIGNNVFITPDFEHTILEGDFQIKGRVSAYVLLWAVWKIYKDSNIRKVLSLLKREEA